MQVSGPRASKVLDISIEVILTTTDIIITATSTIKIIRLAKTPGACWILDVDNNVSVDLSEHKCRVKTNAHLE